MADAKTKTKTTSDFSDTSSVSDTRHLVSQDKDDDRVRSNIPMTSFNFINSIIGSGIIGIPYAFQQTGFGLGILLLLLVAVISDYSIILLIEAGHLSNTDTYQDMVLVAFGRPGFYVLTVLQFLYPFIAMIGYNVIIGDTITKIITRFASNDSLINTVLGNRQFIIFLVSLIVMLPLSLYKNIARLSKWALLAIILVAFILVGVTIRLGTFAHEIEPTEDAWNFANVGITKGIAIMAFAFMCHHNTFLVHASLENPTEKRWQAVTHFSIIVAFIACLFMGVIGYVSFTGYTQGDLLNNYCYSDDLMTAVRFAFAVAIMLTYPIECFVVREVIENSVFAVKDPSPIWRHVAITVTIVILCGGISMATDCLGVFQELDGVLAAAPLAFMIPAVSVIRLKQEPILSKSNIVPILVLLFGTTVAVIGFVYAMATIEEGTKCSHGIEMKYCAVIDHINVSTTVSQILSTSTTSRLPVV